MHSNMHTRDRMTKEHNNGLPISKVNGSSMKFEIVLWNITGHVDLIVT